MVGIITISHWLGCAYIAIAYADGFAEPDDPEVERSWPLHCTWDLTLDLPPGLDPARDAGKRATRTPILLGLCLGR